MLTTRDMHTRECYVVAEEGADRGTIENTIKTKQNKFADYNTTVHFISEEELKEKLSKLERKVLYLHLQGVEYLNIAEFMDKSPKTIDNALQRIKAKARQLLEEMRRSEKK